MHTPSIPHHVSVVVAALAALGSGPALRAEEPLPEGAVLRLGAEPHKHKGRVTALAFSPDGKSLVSGGADGSLWVWDAGGGGLVRELPPRDCPVTAVAFAAGRVAVPAGTGGAAVAVVDPATGRELPRLDVGTSDRVVSLAFSADGKRLAAAAGAVIQVWDVAGEKLVRELSGHSGAVRAVRFVEGGRRLASAGEDGAVRTWDVEADDPAAGMFLKADREAPYAVALSADGRRSASCSYDSVRVWDTAAGVKARTDTGGYALALSDDGGTLAYGRYRLLVRPVGHPDRAVTLTPGGPTLSAVAFSPGGKLVAAATAEGDVQIFESATGRRVMPAPPHRHGVKFVAASPDGKWIATAGRDCLVRVWDAGTGRALWEFPFADDRRAANVAQDWPDALTFAGGGRWLLVAAGAKYDLINLTGPGRGTWPTRETPVAFSPDGSRLVTFERFRASFTVWAVPADRRHGGQVFSLRWVTRNDLPAKGRAAVSPDGKFLAVSTGDVMDQRVRRVVTTPGKIALWDMNSKKLLWESPHGGGEQEPALAFLPGGRVLLARDRAGIDFRVSSSGAVCRKVPLPAADKSKGDPGPWCVSPDGRLIAAAVPDGVVVVEAGSGAEVLRYARPAGSVTSLAFLPGGRRLVSGEADGTAFVWDLAPDRVALQNLAANLTAGGAENLWQTLAGDDAADAYRALWTLSLAPGPALQLFAAKLKATPPPAGEEVAKWIDGLDAPGFRSRERAIQALKELGPKVEPELKVRLAEAGITLEARLRIEKLLRELEEPAPTLEQLRQLRALYALELIGTPEVKPLLARLTGDRLASVVRQAEGTIDRVFPGTRGVPTGAAAPALSPAPRYPANVSASLRDRLERLRLREEQLVFPGPAGMKE